MSDGGLKLLESVIIIIRNVTTVWKTWMRIPLFCAQYIYMEFKLILKESKRKVPRDVRNSKSPETRQVQLSLSWVNWCFESHATIFQSNMWRHRCAGGPKKKLYLRAPNAIDISQGSLTCQSYTDMGSTFLYVDFDTPPQWVAFYDTLWIRRTYSRFETPGVLTG